MASSSFFTSGEICTISDAVMAIDTALVSARCLRDHGRNLVCKRDRLYDVCVNFQLDASKDDHPDYLSLFDGLAFLNEALRSLVPSHQLLLLARHRLAELPCNGGVP